MTTTTTATTATKATTPRQEIPFPIPSKQISRVEEAMQKIQSFSRQAGRPLLMLNNFRNKQCSLNTALNALLTPALTKFFAQLPNEVHPLLLTMRYFARSQLNPGQSVNILLEQLAPVVEGASEFQEIKVHDSHDFLMNLMEGIENVLDGKLKSEWKRLREIFIEETITCPNCKTVIKHVEPECCLQLSVVR